LVKYYNCIASVFRQEFAPADRPLETLVSS